MIKTAYIPAHCPNVQSGTIKICSYGVKTGLFPKRFICKNLRVHVRTHMFRDMIHDNAHICIEYNVMCGHGLIVLSRIALQQTSSVVCHSHSMVTQGDHFRFNLLCFHWGSTDSTTPTYITCLNAA